MRPTRARALLNRELPFSSGELRRFDQLGGRLSCEGLEPLHQLLELGLLQLLRLVNAHDADRLFEGGDRSVVKVGPSFSYVSKTWNLKDMFIF